MEEKKVEKWFENLVTSRKYPLNEAEINEIWNPVKEDLKGEEQINLLIHLVKNDSIWKWLNLISYVLPYLFSENENIINLIEIVVDKIKSDMAQGIFIRTLIDIGERDPDKATNLYARLIETANDVTIHYAGLILGGAAKKEFSKTYKIIETGLQEGKVPVKVACLKAIRVAFETETKIQFPVDILNKMDQLLETEDPSLKYEAIKAYVDFDKFNPEISGRKLLEIATHDNSSARYVIVRSLWFNSLKDPSKEIDILKICAEDKDTATLESILHVLANKGQAFLDESLEIIRRILKNPVYYTLRDIDYYVEKLCENNKDVCLAKFDEWMETDLDRVFCFYIEKLSKRLSQFKR